MNASTKAKIADLVEAFKSSGRIVIVGASLGGLRAVPTPATRLRLASENETGAGGIPRSPCPDFASRCDFDGP